MKRLILGLILVVAGVVTVSSTAGATNPSTTTSTSSSTSTTSSSTSTSTSTLPTTTTTRPVVTTTTTVPATSVSTLPQDPPSELPDTGRGDTGLVIGGLLFGAGLLLMAHHRQMAAS